MSFFGINLASRALQAHERALEVTGQNITNVQTPGYSRQIALLRPVPGPGSFDPSGSANGVAPGGGVDVALVLRTHAAWLDRSAGKATGDSGAAQLSDRYAQELEGVLGEPGSGGLQSTLDDFFTAAGTLAAHPSDLAARDSFLRAGASVGDRIKELTDGIDALRGDVAAGVAENVDRVNTLAKQVADLNATIGQSQATGGAPNELLDQRDQLVQELVQKTGATVSGQEGGQLVVSIGGQAIVQGSETTSLAVSSSDPLQVTLQGSSDPLTFAGGELRAQQQWGEQLLPGYRDQITAVRDNLATRTNALHAGGKGLDGSTGLPFFVADSDGNLSVNPDLLSAPEKVAAGDGTAGDGSLATAIAGLGGAGGPVTTQYSAVVAGIGARAADSGQAAQQAFANLQQIQGMQASETGVNLDEELANMVSLQHAYAASARLLNTFDQMLGTLIERTGV